MNRKQRRQTANARTPARDRNTLSDELRRDHDSAIAFYRARRFSEAEAACRRVLKAQPKHPNVLKLLGNVLAGAGRLDEAVESLRKAIESKPDYANAHSDLGIALCARGDLAGGVQSHQRALRLNPDNAVTHYNLGLALKARGKFDDAVRAYRRAIELKHDFATAHHDLAVLLHAQGELDEAVAAYRRTLDLVPDYEVARTNLEVALRHLEYLSRERDAIHSSRNRSRSVGRTMVAAEYDVVIATDPRYAGGSSLSTYYEIRALSRAGFNVALVPFRTANVRPADDKTNPWLQQAIDCGDVTLVDQWDQVVEARLAIFRNPRAFTALADSQRRFDAAVNILVINHVPITAGDHPQYDPKRIARNCRALAGKNVFWVPQGPLLRRKLEAVHLSEPMLDEDWSPVVFFEDWVTERNRPIKDIPVIGRHSRPDWDKWPATREAMLTVYPDDPSVEVRFLGFGDDQRKLVREVPANWTTFDFNEIEPAALLRSIDFFVFYHHPSWVEPFGRSVAEALASGAVAILPAYFEATYGEAALYREPADVIPTVRELHADWGRYLQQSELGLKLAKQRFSAQSFVARVRRLIEGGA